MKARQLTAMLGLALAATLAFSAVAAGSASAEGPFWIVLLGTESHVLAVGEKEAFTSTSETEFKLDGLTNILCKSEQDTGEIIGGNPGTDLAHIEFLECAEEGKTVAECGASNTTEPGVVLVEVKTVLAYPDPEDRTKALVGFTPDNNEQANNLFVEFTLSGTKCTINNLKVDVNAIGSLITEPPLEKKCGVLAEAGKLNASGVFELTLSGEETPTGVLDTEALLTEAILSGFPELIECKLEAFGAEASELGISKIELVTKNEFGWVA